MQLRLLQLTHLLNEIVWHQTLIKYHNKPKEPAEKQWKPQAKHAKTLINIVLE